MVRQWKRKAYDYQWFIGYKPTFNFLFIAYYWYILGTTLGTLTEYVSLSHKKVVSLQWLNNNDVL